MAYTKNTWADGDIVTSEKLNHMEGGIENASGVMVINIDNGVLDKTWQEIYDSMVQGKSCVARENTGTLEGDFRIAIVSSVGIFRGEYVVLVANMGFYALSATDYPMRSSEAT